MQSQKIKQEINVVTQHSETQPAKLILLHNPQFESYMTSLHPCGSLYEEPLNIKEAQDAYNNIKNKIEEYGIQTITLEWLVENALKDEEKKKFLLNFAAERLIYKCDFSNKLSEIQKYHLSDEYKLEVLNKYQSTDIVQIILGNPTIFLERNARYPQSTDLKVTKIQYKPLGNFIFQRDNLITTMKGPIIGQQTSQQRKDENLIVKFMFDLMNIKYYEIPDGNPLEGGDYVPSNTIAFMGVGVRTSIGAINYLLENNLFGEDRVAVVIDKDDQNQQRMHLDTVFNVVDDKRVVLHEDIMGNKPKYPRLVTEYKWNTQTNLYDIIEKGMPFDQFLLKNGFQIIPITEKEQNEYMINFLNIGNNTIISVHQQLEQKLKQHGYQGKVEFVNYKGILKMYGAAHCSTQVFREGSKYKIFDLVCDQQ